MEVVLGDTILWVGKMVQPEHYNSHFPFHTEFEGHMDLHEAPLIQEVHMMDLLDILDRHGTPPDFDIVDHEVPARYHYCCKGHLGGAVMFPEVRKVSQDAPDPEDVFLVLMTYSDAGVLLGGNSYKI